MFDGLLVDYRSVGLIIIISLLLAVDIVVLIGSGNNLSSLSRAPGNARAFEV